MVTILAAALSAVAAVFPALVAATVVVGLVWASASGLLALWWVLGPDLLPPFRR